jgi:hypothetical protein
LIPFLLLVVITLICGLSLYLYPPNIPLKIKMMFLGIAFSLAFGGLFLVDIFSYWLSVAVVLAFAFVASYLAEKKMDFAFINGTGNETLIFLEKPADVIDQPEAEFAAAELEAAVTQDEPLVAENPIFDNEIVDLEEVIELEEIEIKEIETDDITNIEQEELLQEELNPVIVELTDDEFAFLSESREISEEETIEDSDLMDMEDEEIFLQRTAFLDELEELDKRSHQPDLIEEVSSELKQQETAESVIEEELVLDADLLVLPENVDLEREESSEEAEIVELATEDNLVFSLVTEEETIFVEEKVEVVENMISYPDMDSEVQEMLVNTLASYQQMGDVESYEIMMHSILDQSLSDKDFYLFSKLLLEFYASESQVEKMKGIMDGMNARLHKYPVITEEIDRYKDSVQVKENN